MLKCEYTLSVMPIVECPSRSWTTFGWRVRSLRAHHHLCADRIAVDEHASPVVIRRPADYQRTRGVTLVLDARRADRTLDRLHHGALVVAAAVVVADERVDPHQHAVGRAVRISRCVRRCSLRVLCYRGRTREGLPYGKGGDVCGWTVFRSRTSA